MTHYLLKFILCSAILYGLYYFLLAGDRSFRFNRFYLLSIMIVALIIPGIITKTNIIELPDMLNSVFTTEVISESTSQIKAQPAVKAISTWYWLKMAYVLVSTLLLLRFITHLITLYQFRKRGKVAELDGVKLVLRPDIHHSFSFLNYIFTNQDEFERGQLPGEIIDHERAHIKQKHSYDIIFTELMICMLWFNPVIYLLRKSVKLNHEYLADEAVISKTGGIEKYQRIIIDFASQHSATVHTMASHLNYGQTKKRLFIMAKQHKKGLSMLKQSAVPMVIIVLLLSFGAEKTIAQQNIMTTPAVVLSPQASEQDPQDAPPPHPPVIVKLNPRAKVRFNGADGKKVTAFFGDLTDSQKGQFMDQGKKAEILIPPPPRAHMTAAMLEDFQDAKKYGLWIDGKREKNSVLANYQRDDFHHFFKTHVSKHSKNHGEYEYHLEMITMKHKEEFLKGRWIPFKPGFIPKPGEKEDDGIVVRRKSH